MSFSSQSLALVLTT